MRAPASLWPLLASAALLWVGHGATAPRAQETDAAVLRVCLNESLPPYSLRNGESGSGFDFMIADAVAKRLGRRLVVQWFEDKIDEDSSSAIEANALLSDGRCELVGGYPLVKDALGKPGLESARMPDFEGARPADRRRRVTLGTLAATRPYHFAALTIVLAGKAVERHIGSLADLDGVELGIDAGTLGDAILMRFGGGRLIDHITHVIPGRGELLPRMERGDYDATLIPVHRLDAYRLEHPDTRLKPSGYYFPIGFNMGFVGLADEKELIDRVNLALDDMSKHGESASFAAAVGMTYLPPRQPFVLDGISMNDLAD